MFCSLPIEDRATGRQGFLFVEILAWAGYTISFSFYDSLAHNEGSLEYDALKRSVQLKLTQPACTLTAMERVSDFFRQILPRYTPGFSMAIDQISGLYSGDYFVRHGYSLDSAAERRLKEIFATTTIRAVQPRKVLIAGCAAGEELRVFRALGVEAWGFDIAADAVAAAYPEVRPFVRVGSLSAIPYGPDDQFDLLAAFDVFEHVPEEYVPAMVGEIARLGVKHLVTQINHLDFFEEGHITLRPIEWWVEAFRASYRLIPLDVDFQSYPELYQIPGAIRHRMRLWGRLGPGNEGGTGLV